MVEMENSRFIPKAEYNLWRIPMAIGFQPTAH
jgi:hypothetical protein